MTFLLVSLNELFVWFVCGFLGGAALLLVAIALVWAYEKTGGGKER